MAKKLPDKCRVAPIPKTLGEVEEKRIETDVLIIGGGTAGCLAAWEAKKRNPELRVTIVEKANIVRSGCLAAGMDALNTCIPKNETFENFVRWSRWQAGGLLREDLTLTMLEELNNSIDLLESWGLPVKRDETGDYVRRGKWDVAIYGADMKLIMAEAVKEAGIEVLNWVNVTNYILDGKRVAGAFGFGLRDGKFYIMLAKATICCTGGAAGLYKPYQQDGIDSHHQLWYSPFNTGSGYAMGIRAGAEMTSFENRWCAIRTKDFNGPIDTISVGYKADMINAKGEKILQMRYAEHGGDAAPRYIRNYAAMKEWLEGRGPVYVDTTVMNEEQVEDLIIDYLNERPTYVLFLAARGIDPSKEPLEVYGSDPYIVGGHCMAGYWIDNNRKTTLEGLYAAGDVAGGVPNKFVGGCWAEGIIAGRAAVKYASEAETPKLDETQVEKEKKRVFAPAIRWHSVGEGVSPQEMEERLQRLMDEYAGGVHQFYRMNAERLEYALKHIRILKEQTQYLYARDLHELMKAMEVIDMLDVAEVAVHHFLYRKETRWPAWHERLDYPGRDDENWLCFVNSVRDPETGEIKVFTRPYEQIVPGDRYKP